MNRLAVFDCDGTLVDSAATICRAMAAGFAACGLPHPGDEPTRAIIGLSLPQAIAALHPDPAPNDALCEAYKAAFHAMRASGDVSEPLFDGIAEAIGHLDEAGWLLGVATGKSDRGLNLILEHHGLHPRFVTLQTADRHPSKPHPSMLEQAMADAGAAPATTVMIGDTSYDMEMAVNAGVRAIGVAWGSHDAATLHAAGADVVATHPTELAALIEGLR